MQIAYDVEPEDLVALHAQVLERSPAVRRQTTTLRLVCAGLALLGVTSVGLFAGAGHLAVWLAGGAAGALVGYLAFPRWFRGAALHRARQRYESVRGRERCGRHHLILEDTGLRARADAEEQVTPWRELREVVRGPERVFLFAQPDRAHVIPISRVVGGDLLAFLEQVEARVTAQGQGAAKEAP